MAEEYWQVVVRKLKERESVEQQRALAQADAARDLAEIAMLIIPGHYTPSALSKRFYDACAAYRSVR